MPEPVKSTIRNLAALVSSRMKALKWSDQDLAQEAKIGVRPIEQLKEGTGYFSIPDLLKVFRILGITITHEKTWTRGNYHLRKTHNLVQSDDGRTFILEKGKRLGKAPKKPPVGALY